MLKKIKLNDLVDFDQGIILKFLVKFIYDIGDDEMEKLFGLVYLEFKDREFREKYKNLYYFYGSKIKVDFYNMVDVKIWVRKILDEVRVNYIIVGYNCIENLYLIRIFVDMDWVKNFNLINQDVMQLFMKCGVFNYE